MFINQKQYNPNHVVFVFLVGEDMFLDCLNSGCEQMYYLAMKTRCCCSGVDLYKLSPQYSFPLSHYQ